MGFDIGNFDIGNFAIGDFAIGSDDPRASDVQALLDAHLAFAKAVTPPEDVHALDEAGRLNDGLTYFSVRYEGQLLGVGALRHLDESHAEIKSMHTAAAVRQRGVGRALLQHLVQVAQEGGYGRISLETGPMDAFGPARALYTSAGFQICEPFGDYGPNSVCMTRYLV